MGDLWCRVAHEMGSYSRTSRNRRRAILYRPQPRGNPRGFRMPSSSQQAIDKTSRGGSFATTRWSLVAAAAGEGRAPLTELCLRYWYPVFAHARRCGHPPEAAQAITQAFFRFLVAERLREVGADPPHRFREWLQVELTKFLASGWSAQEPGPADKDKDKDKDKDILPPLPTELLEQRHRAEGTPATSIDAGFRRSFALEVLGRGLNRLRREAQQATREAMFEKLAPYLTKDPVPGQYEAIAGELGTRPLALVVALKRLRQRFRELVDDELAESVTSHDDL